LGRITALHAGQSQKYTHASVGIVSTEECPQIGHRMALVAASVILGA
jgi:hypothetical protein